MTRTTRALGLGYLAGKVAKLMSHIVPLRGSRPIRRFFQVARLRREGRDRVSLAVLVVMSCLDARKGNEVRGEAIVCSIPAAEAVSTGCPARWGFVHLK